MNASAHAIAKLRAARPRSRRVEWSWRLLAVLLLLPWIAGDFSLGELISGRRLDNARRFAGELVPYPLQGRSFSIAEYAAWLGRLMHEKGLLALKLTLAISVLAIIAAGLLGFAASFLGARIVVMDECLTRKSGMCVRCAVRRAGLFLVRLFLLFLRSVPEYIWAFILLMVLGTSAWPGILALAIHNSGILGKLNAEFIDDLPRAPLAAMRDCGAGRGQIALLGTVPLVFNRFLLFFFVRWETCVRESTVLGLLGILSLGYWIEDARSRNHYDVMVHMVLLGAAMVMLGDLVSTALRALIRRL